MRLDKWLATLGKGSRSEVRQMIRDGQAAVNGQTVRDPAYNKTRGVLSSLMSSHSIGYS